ncbi:MAG TPA: cupin domain-containing protein, partial [Chloroflexota bacterium]
TSPRQAWRSDRLSNYEQWIRSIGIPIHRGYFVEDGRTAELGEWEEREHKAAILVLAGNENVAEFRISEIAPGQTLPPVTFGLDELVYVLSGRGLTNIWAGDGPKKSFEWSQRSMFCLPRGSTYQLTNTSGNTPVRLLQYNYLPQAMRIQPDPEFYFNSGYANPKLIYSEENVYAMAKQLPNPNPNAAALGRPMWSGNFFPDLAAWEHMHTYQERGGGGHRMGFQIPNSSLNGHMSAFPSRTYKKGHRHGPGTLIVIPSGEGFSYMWPEGSEKIYIPWHEGSIFVPPDQWFHQHFNVGAEPARYLAFHGGGGRMGGDGAPDPERDQIEYTAEDPLVRQTFERELGKLNITSLMPEQCYTDPKYEFEYSDDDD